MQLRIAVFGLLSVLGLALLGLILGAPDRAAAQVDPRAGTTGGTATPTACPGVFVVGEITDNSPSHTDALMTDSVTSTCANPKSCPGIYTDSGHYHYDAHTFVNSLNTPQCLTVTVGGSSCGNYIFSAAYLGSFDPTDLCANYLADPGVGTNGDLVYSFTVPAGGTFVVEVEEMLPDSGGCLQYGLTIDGCVVELPPTSTPTPGTPAPSATPGTPTATRTVRPSNTPSPTLTPTLTPTSTPTRTALPGCPPAWSVVDSPNAGNGPNSFHAVAAVSASDVWAVGATGTNPLITHWNGAVWSIVPSPVLSGALLSGITALGPSDVWAVGSYTGTNPRTLTEHWNGSTWSVVPSADPGPDGNMLFAVAGRAANDVWAVGGLLGLGYIPAPMIEHWDGAQWSAASLPTLDGSLHAVALTGPNEGWAVGEMDGQPLTLQLIGSNWFIVPNPGGYPDTLYGVGGASPDAVWAVGDNGTQTLIMRWDGSAWSIVPSPQPGTQGNTLHGLALAAADDLWAVGSATNNGASSVPLILQGDGSGWQVAASPARGSYPNLLDGVAALWPGDIWAVGQAQADVSPTSAQTLTEHYVGVCGTPSATVSPTATATRIAPSATATTPAASGTPTPCSIRFSDVQPTDYFYGPVQYLACQGVISGYADGTFRPYANTTRAQMVKIVVLGFGRPLQTPTAGDYTFADVPPTQPFFTVIQTAAADQIVSGYACGGVSEPCDAQHRPYFRPYANVTRGQLAKIVVGAASWPIDTSGGPHFADVPPSHPFYPFVETAYNRAILSGYSDHTFRVGASATRGQIAKIVWGALQQP